MSANTTPTKSQLDLWLAQRCRVDLQLRKVRDGVIRDPVLVSQVIHRVQDEADARFRCPSMTDTLVRQFCDPQDQVCMRIG